MLKKSPVVDESGYGAKQLTNLKTIFIVFYYFSW